MPPTVVHQELDSEFFVRFSYHHGHVSLFNLQGFQRMHIQNSFVRNVDEGDGSHQTSLWDSSVGKCSTSSIRNRRRTRFDVVHAQSVLFQPVQGADGSGRSRRQCSSIVQELLQLRRVARQNASNLANLVASRSSLHDILLQKVINFLFGESVQFSIVLFKKLNHLFDRLIHPVVILFGQGFLLLVFVAPIFSKLHEYFSSCRNNFCGRQFQIVIIGIGSPSGMGFFRKLVPGVSVIRTRVVPVCVGQLGIVAPDNARSRNRRDNLGAHALVVNLKLSAAALGDPDVLLEPVHNVGQIILVQIVRNFSRFMVVPDLVAQQVKGVDRQVPESDGNSFFVVFSGVDSPLVSSCHGCRRGCHV
mmetsp:Transcript_6869/g.16741  ORF Transcript_6869/g.16741 Transcript_6869/m.16741 type:complete len:360 (-) Transcript_6869:327-1406(-)